ncbi:MAG: hypothetical protein BGO49_10140 [Planctomycetales bacterium 71-10]|nr:MAG: hypothetical protein BGO49_10140 [Planctomycetales bacterium 71-10]
MASLRIGPGPVFACEWLRISRRWQLYAARSLSIGLVLLGLAFTWGSWSGREAEVDLALLAFLGQIIYATIATIELTLVLVAAPAATAGSVCLDKARGSLIQVMATDLTDSEIVLGKLAAALLPVVGLVFSVLPVLMLASLLGGIDPMLLLGSFLITLATAVLACTLAFTLSVWGKKTHEVLGATYLILLAWLALVPFFGAMLLQAVGYGGGVQQWMELVWRGNPYGLMYPDYNQPSAEHLIPVAIYAAACLGLSAAMAVACIGTIRPAALKQRAEGGTTARRRRLLPRLPSLLPAPSLDANPVLWREWCRARPSRWGRFVAGGYGLFAIMLAGLAIWEANARPSMFGEMTFLANVYIVSVGLLLMSVRASTALSEERVRGSLDVLLTTPMPTTAIMAGKWWGTFRGVAPLLLLPALIAAGPCLRSWRWPHLAAYLGLIASYAALTTSAGLAIAVRAARQGRAVGLGVGLYAASCIGWPILTALSRQGDHGLIFLLGSPIAGAVMGSSAVIAAEASDWPARALIHCTIWGALQFGVALLLFRLACESFDEKLGRAADPAERNVPWRFARALIPRFRAEPDEAA